MRPLLRLKSHVTKSGCPGAVFLSVRSTSDRKHGVFVVAGALVASCSSHVSRTRTPHGRNFLDKKKLISCLPLCHSYSCN